MSVRAAARSLPELRPETVLRAVLVLLRAFRFLPGAASPTARQAVAGRISAPPTADIGGETQKIEWLPSFYRLLFRL